MIVLFSVFANAKTSTLETLKGVYKPNDLVSVKVDGTLSGDKDWVGIFPKNADNSGSNVVAWGWISRKGTFDLNTKIKPMPAGEYVVKLFFHNSYHIEAIYEFKVSASLNTFMIGVREVKATSKNKGKLFASPNGQGDCMSYDNACDIYTAIGKLSQTNNVLFLRGGTYHMNKQLLITKRGTKNKPIIIESYPGEHAILDGGATIDTANQLSKKMLQAIYIVTPSAYVKIRKLEIQHMPVRGISILQSSNNTVEGCKIHDNHYVGIHIHGNDKANNNLIRDNIIYNNSDAGLYDRTVGYNYGGNADGISISGGNGNSIVHNEVYHNSDDGIDSWLSNDTYIAYNLSYNNGIDKGDGNGIKAGGDQKYLHKVELPPYGKNAIVEYNLAFNNRASGIDVNQGRNVTFRYNTSYNNGRYGFLTIKDTKIQHNISSNNKQGAASRYLGEGKYINDVTAGNSWRLGAKISFINTNNIHSSNFLRPVVGSVFENMGAYADIPNKQ